MYNNFSKLNLFQNLNNIYCKRCLQLNKNITCEVFNLVIGFKYHGIPSCNMHSKEIELEIKEFEKKYCIYDLSSIIIQDLTINLLDGSIIKLCSLEKIIGYDGIGTTFMYKNQLMIFVGKKLDSFSKMYIVKLIDLFKDNNINYEKLNLPEQIKFNLDLNLI